MRNHMIVSGTLHTALIALMVLGMPPRDRQLELPSSESFEVVDISEITAPARIEQGEPRPEPVKAPPAPPEAKPAPPPPPPPEPEEAPPPPPPPEPKVPQPPPLPEPPKPLPPPPPPEPPKPEPPKPEPPKPPPPPVPDEPTLPKPPEPKPEPPKPEPKPQPPKPEPPKAEPPKPEPPKPEPPKPEVKKPEVKKPPEKEVAKTDPLADLLSRTQKVKSTEKTEEKKPATEPSTTRSTTTAQAAPSGATRATRGPEQAFRPSGRAIDAIRSQVSRNWNFDPGRKDSDTMQVAIRIEVDRDGSVKTAVIDDRFRARYTSDRAYAAAVDAAVRAIRRSSPLDLMKEEFTPQTYESWRTILFTFDPRDMF